MGKKNKQHLLFLIRKLLDGSISKKEISILFYFFINNQKITKWPENHQEKAQIEEKIFNKVKAQINEDESVKVIKFYNKPIFKYAIAASIVLLITLPFFINEINTPIKTPASISNIIVPGSNKATLTLHDGSTIALTNHKNLDSIYFSSNGKSLKYKNSMSQNVAYNYLTIPRGGQYQIILPDGTKVWLNSESQLKYPISFKGHETRTVELVYGEAYFDVTSSKLNNGSKFNVVTSHHNVEVLGTEFNIKAYKDETAIYTTLVEGKVAINTTNKNEQLTPNHQANFNKNKGNIIIKPVDVYNEVSWKNGVFSFENKSLKDIMKVLSRWYDINVVFLNKNIETEEFVGVIGKEQKIENILTIIKDFGTINSYTIKGKTIQLN
ncbi:FecR family protein [Flavivirga amylovorans]|uniref:FecR family protein n=1 Tax=Flavivirga amylovorans TaxID=870486 RepID=A0ABT8WZG0_9FLAO|nr:FecR family protein [Flavivirga amylovorans]MDO5987062.1 FecR family protein [Flavivirga amylovorans]